MTSYFQSLLSGDLPKESYFRDHVNIQAPKIHPENPWHGFDDAKLADSQPPQHEKDSGLVDSYGNTIVMGGSKMPRSSGADSVVVANAERRYAMHKYLNQFCGEAGSSARLSCVAKDSLQKSRDYKAGPWYNPYSYGSGKEITIHNERLQDGTIATLLYAYPEWGLKNMANIAAGMRKAIGALQTRKGLHEDMHSGQFMFKYVDKGGDFKVNGKNAIVVLHDMDDVYINETPTKTVKHLKQYVKAVYDMFTIALDRFPDAAPEWHAKFNQLDNIMGPLGASPFYIEPGFKFVDEGIIKITYHGNAEWDHDTMTAAVRTFDKVLNNPTVPEPEVPVQGLAIKGKQFMKPYDRKWFNELHTEAASGDIVCGASARNEHHLKNVYKFKYGLSDVTVAQHNYYENTHHPVFVVTWPSATDTSNRKYGVDVIAYKKFKEEYKAMQVKYGEVSNAVPLSSFPSLVSAIKSGKYGRGNNMENLLNSPVGQFLQTASAIFETREASWSDWVGLTPTQIAGDYE